MNDITCAWLTIFITPLCVAFIVLYFQQLKDVRTESEDRKAALQDLAEAKKENLALQNSHRDNIARLKENHEIEIQRKDREIQKMDISTKLMKFAKESPDAFREIAQTANKTREATE